MKVLLWFILLVLCWPVALLFLVFYPFIWLILIPFRMLGFAVNLSFDIVKTVIMFPFRLLGYKG